MTATVAFDAGPAKAQPTGVGVYVRELGTALVDGAYEATALIGVRPDGPLAATASRAVRRTFMSGRLYQAWLQREADRDARQVGAELVHYSNASAPVIAHTPFVVTIQDLSLIRYARSHPLPRLATVPIIVAAARRARAVIVPSRATAAELQRMLRVDPRRIHVIELAPAPGPNISAGDRLAVLQQLRLLDRPYVLSIATLEPRKNLVRLIHAFELLAESKPDLRLVLLGARGWKWRSIEDAIEASPHRDRIVVPGYVSDLKRQALLDGAAVFAYVSLYEGYGLPVVEAMAAHVPVVTSRRSSLPEAAAGAAVLVDPLSVPEIAGGLQAAMDRRDELISMGTDRVGSLSWARVARETAMVYEEALTGP
ncbi:MAG TPA: glycosyltransferase family 1 protein [Coriobacteriia bacterium]